jgi:hypothetical protein
VTDVDLSLVRGVRFHDRVELRLRAWVVQSVQHAAFLDAGYGDLLPAVRADQVEPGHGVAARDAVRIET